MDDERERPESAVIREMVERVDGIVRDAESVRAHVDRAMRRRPFWPDRRQPRHWSDTDRPDEPSNGSDDERG
jgi:hypothetical protein